MNTFRIGFTDTDLSFSNPVPDTTAKGFMVVRAPKGTTEAIYFPKGSQNLILSTIGLPSKTWPDIQDALDFNANFGLWISAPAGANSYYGSTYLTSYGLLSGWRNETSKTEPAFEIQLPFGEEEKIVTALTSTTKTWSSNTILISALNNTFIGKLNGVVLNYTNSTTNETFEMVALVDGTDLKVGSTIVGTTASTTLTITGAISIDGFDLSGTDATYVQANIATVSLTYLIDVTNESYLQFIQKSPRDASTTVTITDFSAADNTISFTTSEVIYPNKTTVNSEVSGSLIPGTVNGYNANIYLQDVYPDNAYTPIEINVIKEIETGSSLVIAANTTATLTGSRGTMVDVTVLTEGWTEATKPAYETIKIFMEPSCLSGIKTAFAAIVESQPLSIGITGRKLTQGEFNDITTVIAGATNKQIGVYVGEFLRKENYTSTKYYSNLIGAVGAKLAKIIQDGMGGIAPMFTDTNGMGGSLSVSFDAVRWEFSKEQLRALNTKNLNPIINDNIYGLLIAGQKTTQTAESDWSYLGHTMAFLEFKREIRDFVMIPQLGLPNNTFYQNMRLNQANAILNKRLSGANPVWTAGKIYISEVNTDEIKAARKFLIVARVKVTVFSEYVELVLANIDQTATV